MKDFMSHYLSARRSGWDEQWQGSSQIIEIVCKSLIDSRMIYGPIQQYQIDSHSYLDTWTLRSTNKDR